MRVPECLTLSGCLQLLYAVAAHAACGRVEISTRDWGLERDAANVNSNMGAVQWACCPWDGMAQPLAEWKPLIPELFRKNSLIPGMAGIEKDRRRQIARFAHLDLCDRFDFRMVGNGVHRPLVGLEDGKLHR